MSTIDHVKYINNQQTVSVDDEIINLHTGRMTYRLPVCATTGNERPYSLELYYRGDGFGSEYNEKWYTNFDQYVEKVGNTEAIYVDATGKQHHFVLGADGKYHDIEGLEMRLDFIGVGTNSAGTENISATLYHKNGAHTHFNSFGELEALYDSHNNGIFVNLTDNSLEIRDNNYHPTKVTYANYAISKIYDEAEREYTVTTSGAKITRINFPDGTNTQFTYSSDGNITQVKKRDGVRIKYVYDYNTVTAVQKFAADNNTTVPDEYTEFEYRGSRYSNKKSSTVVKDRTGINRVYVFDEEGRTILAYEEKPSASSVDHKNVTGTVSYAYTDKKLTFAAKINLDDDTHNLVTNGSFESGTGSWDIDGSASVVDTEAVNGEKMLKMTSSGYIEQNVTVTANDLKFGDTVILSAWTKKLDDNDSFSLSVNGAYANGDNISNKSVDFSEEYNDWQYAAIPLILDKSDFPVTLNISINKNGDNDDGYIDNIRLCNASAVRREYVVEPEDYTYVFGKRVDVYERVTTCDGIYTTQEAKDYFRNTVKKKIIDLDGNAFESVYEYDSSNNLIYSQDYKNVITAYTYTGSLVSGTRTFYHSVFNPTLTDAIVNGGAAVITATDYEGVGEEYPMYVDDERSVDIWSRSGYHEECADMLEDQAQRGSRGLVNTYVTPNKLITSYEYDTEKDDALTNITAKDGNFYRYPVDFAYDSARRLNKITRNGFDYDFTYDGMGRMKTVSVAGAQYCENEYDTSTDTTTVTTTYNGGEKLKVTTDKHQNPVKKSYINANGVETVLAEAEYDNLGKVTKYIDKTEQKEYTYTYNELGNVESVKLNGVPYKQYTYDSHGRETALSIPSHNYTYTYERTPAQSGQSRKIYPHNEKVGSTVFGRFSTTVAKDNIGRRSTKSWNLISYDIDMKDRYTYLDTAERLTHYVSKLEQMDDGSNVDRTYDYTYDNDGNITEIKIDGVTTFTYTYDKLGQLTRENNRLLDVTYRYIYDDGGNLTSRKKYAYTTGTVGTVLETDTYTYDTVNKDRLVSYNNQPVTYDGKGNPLTYKGNTLTWDRVRLLSGYGTNTFSYNADGIRIRKNGTNYTLDGSNVIREYDNSGKDIYFNYDLDGVCGFRIGDTDYFYRKNLQGDITDIYHANGTKYASYVYDAWGNCTVTLDVGGIGTLNPFRYRGYYYDTETGLYYLKSRYYDPVTGRFINADELIDKSKILGFNLYGYCQNNPIMLVDDDGNLAYPGEIHNRVVAHLAATHGLIPEQKILYENGHGRADLMNASGYIWEVKPNNERNIKKGRKQLEKYVSGKWSFNEATKLSYGYELPSGSFFYSPNSTTSYIVTYHYLDNGLIVYDYKENINWDLVEQGAKAAAGAAATLIILFVSTAVLKYPIVV